MNVPYDKQGEDGKFEPTYDPDDFVAAVESLDLPTTSDVADYVECPHRTALHHLNQLEDAGRLVSRKVGPAKVWRVSEERPGGTSTTDTPAGGGAESDTATSRERAREILADLDRPGEGTDYNRRRDAVLQMYDHLRSNPGERLGKQDFKNLLAGEDVGYSGGFTSLWSNWVKANENQGRPENALVVLPGVEQRGDDYVYQGAGDE